MDDTFRKNCEALAVRLGLNKGRVLLGSGVVLVPGDRRHALILTAAHLFDRLKDEGDLKLHVYFVGLAEDPQDTELTCFQQAAFAELPDGKTAHFYLHPDYKPTAKGYPLCDAAILQIPYAPWMAGLPVFRLTGPREIKTPMLFGFPSKDDAAQNDPAFERDARFVTFRGDLFRKSVELFDQGNANIVVKEVYRDPSPFNTGHNKLDGLSGGGIFSCVGKGIRYNGAFVMTKGEDSYYATDASVFVDLFRRLGLAPDTPPELSLIRKDSLEHFKAGRAENSFAWFGKKSTRYIGEIDMPRFLKDSFSASDSLSCAEYRPLCRTYYEGKLIGSVLFSSLYGIAPADVNDQVIEIDGDKVHLTHICSENCIELVVEEALRGSAFSARGPFRNKSIFVLNGKNAAEAKKVKRGKCHKIITSVLGRMRDELSFREDYSDYYQLLSDENREDEDAEFSIIEGDLTRAQMAFLPLKDLEECMFNDLPSEEDLKASVDGLLAWVWKE